MPKPGRFAAVILLSVLLQPVTTEAQNFFPRRVTPSLLTQPPYSSAGIVASDFAMGSGAVAHDRRLVYTCGHVFFDWGRWSRSFRFARAYNRAATPPLRAYRPLRGYRYLSSYSGSSSAQGFSSDFAIGFGSTSSDFGPVLAVPPGPAISLVRSAASKFILGYPERMDFNGVAGGSFQHRTGPFNRPFRPVFGPFHWIPNVSTGSGNSGGPLLVRQGSRYVLAGVLLSGSQTTAGIYALDATSIFMAREALIQAGALPPGPTRWTNATNRQRLALPDGSSAYQARYLRVAGQGTDLRRLFLTLEITTTFRGDLDVYIRSPRGRVRWVQRRDPQAWRPHLRLRQYEITGDFLGSNPNGTWGLFMRDGFPQDRATYHYATLRFGTR